MFAEALPRRWAVLLLGAALLTTGCVTLAPPPGAGPFQGPHALSTLGETAVGRPPPLQRPLAVASSAVGGQARLYRQQSARGPAADVAQVLPEAEAPREVARGESAPQGPATCGGRAVPPGWPDFSSGREELLAPFLTCTSPAEFLALQQHVDMPRLVAALDDWRAVRLGAQGPVREDAASLLNLKRTSLLLHAAERYGPLAADVLSVFLVDTAHDDELREILFLLARDKRLAPTLAQLPSFQAALEHRGLKPTARVDRDFQWKDLGRGLAQAGKDALSTIPVLAEVPAINFLFIREQLPPHYQQALEEAEREEMKRHFSAGRLALGIFDHLTFGVPVSFYGLVAATGHGAYALSQGEYEQATRELAPAVLLVALYAGGKGARYLSEARGTPGSGLAAVELRARGLGEVARRLESVLGVEGLRELAREIQASREAGRFVAVGGMDAALALREARGHVAQAQVLLSRAHPGATGAPAAGSGARKGPGQVAAGADDAARASRGAAGAAERPGTLASLVDEGVGHSLQVVEAKLAAVELEAPGPRLPREVGVLEQHRPFLDAPPPEARGNRRELDPRSDRT